MKAYVVTVRDPFHPARNRESRTVARRRRVSALAPRTDLPFIAVLNGQPLLRSGWNRKLRDNDHLAFISLPLGGDGDSNPLQMILMIAVMVFAPYAATTLMGLEAGTMGAALATAGIGMLGSMLVNAIIPPPKLPSAQQAAALASPSPTYDINASGNMARLKAAIPVHYGRLRFPPDFAAAPYAEYAGNEQYLYQLFCLGQGYFDVEAISIEDTPISSFPEITYELVPPGGRVTLYPANVTTSIEVAGQEALTGTALGPFVANAAGTTLNAIAIDVVASHGLFYANDSGSLDSKSITWKVEARPIDVSGSPLAGWSVLGTETMTAATTTPQRRSDRYTVAEGRYEVKLTRTDTKDTSSRAGHELDWVGLRGYLPGTQQYGQVTMLAMRMRASNSLSSAASRKIYVTATRKLKTWNPSTGWSMSETATRSIAWAIADAARSIDYGAELPDARIGLAELYALDNLWTSRGDHFDGRFDNSMTFWEAVNQLAKVGRAKPYMQGGILHVARDGTQSVPVAMFQMRNIVRGSFSVGYTVLTSDTADAIDATYFDEQLWAQRPVRAKLTGSAELNVADIDLFGVVNRNHAWREAMYQLAATKYRPKTIKFTAEMEGFIPSFGDLIAVSHDMPQWGQSAEAVSWNAGTRTLRVSEPLTFTTGTHYIGLARRDNSVDGPIAVTAGADAYTLVLATAPDFTPYTGDAEERTRIAFGPGVNWSQLAVVAFIRPKGLHQVEIEAVNYDDRVNTADASGTAPAASISNLPTTITTPAITGALAVVIGGTVDAPTLSATWQAASGASSYLVEHSFDGQVWTRVGEPTSPSFLMTTVPGAQQLRVAPLGVSKGAWLTWSGSVAGGASVVPAPAPTGFTAVASENSIFLSWTNPSYGYIDRVEILRNTTNSPGGAQVIGSIQGPVGFYPDYIGSSGATRYYWLRVVNTKGIAGTLSGVASATTGQVTGVPPANSVVHSMMAADAVWAGNIKAGEVQANHMAANSITAGNAALANASITTAKIIDGQVTTLKIGAQQVTIPSSAYTAGSVNILNVGELTLQSCSMTSTGAPIFISGSFSFDGNSGAGNAEVRIYRDSTLLWSSIGPEGGAGTGPVSIQFTDTGQSAGFHTYSMRLYNAFNTNNLVGSRRSLSLLETQR